MISNLEKYKKDLENLIVRGDHLEHAFEYDFYQDYVIKCLEKKFQNDSDKKTKIDKIIKQLPNFYTNYQQWYSESLVLIRQLLPNRENDFIDFYKKPKNRKQNIGCEIYTIEDALLRLTITKKDPFGVEKITADKTLAYSKFQQQLSILKSLERKFESSLFDIKQLVQADLFDSELDAAKELNKKGFIRAAGAIAGVVLESHLLQVCDNHKIKIREKNTMINNLAQLLKDNDVIEIPEWRKIQHLADLRNSCTHKREANLKKDDIDDLINGVSKIIKTLF